MVSCRLDKFAMNTDSENAQTKDKGVLLHQDDTVARQQVFVLVEEAIRRVLHRPREMVDDEPPRDPWK